jgi:tetratricopeptide (TPR) repeat protein
MKQFIKSFVIPLLFAVALAASHGAGWAAGLQDEVRSLQQGWEQVKYGTPAAGQASAYEALAKRAAEVRSSHPGRAEPEIWYGIIVASQAGARGGLGALALAKDAKKSFERALALDSSALEGSAYTSLGSLYYQVPGWPIGFGDDDKARELLEKALAINPAGMDPNFFMGDLLYRKGDYQGARSALARALKAPPRPERPLADAGRRKEIETLMQDIKARSG